MKRCGGKSVTGFGFILFPPVKTIMMNSCGPADINRVLTITVQSSEPLAMTWSLWGHQSMSNTGPVWPHTVG